jgi:putative transcriptional regulator
MERTRNGHTEGVQLGPTPTKGRLLLATPPLEDPNFDRTVVFVLEHSVDGALGVVINRPSEEQLDEPLHRWSELQADPGSVFLGGPVEPDALIALARSRRELDEPTDELSPILGHLVSADLSVDPALVASDIESVRVFRGYAGWGPGQLEGEIDAGAWLVLDTAPDDLFTGKPEDLWRQILRRQGGRLAWLASVPDDLSAN